MVNDMHLNAEQPLGTLHKSGEDYLEAILVLSTTKGNVRSIDVAEYLGFSKASVSHAVSVLGNEGYLIMGEDRLLHLTETGARIAKEIYERHQFFTKYLIKIGVDPQIAEADACRMEHAISVESFRCLKKALGDSSDPT